MNRRHGLLERYALAVLGYGGAFAVTGRRRLASRLFDELRSDFFFSALRRALWYAAWGWPPRFDARRDAFFLPASGMDADGSAELLSFFEQRRGQQPYAHLDTEAGIRAGRIHALAEHERMDEVGDELVLFADCVDAHLSRLHEESEARDFSKADACLDRSRGAHKREGPEDFARDAAEQALRDVARWLPLSSWGWCVLTGTFLGLHREGDFLAHDLDIDLGLPAEETDFHSLEKALRDAPFFCRVEPEYQLKFKRESGEIRTDFCPVLVKAVHTNGVAVDFSLLYSENGVYWHGAPFHRWEHQRFDLEERVLRGVTVLAPRQADRYLTEAYGDWRTPVKSFSCSTGSPNLALVRNPLGIALFLKRLTWHIEHVDVSGYQRVLSAMVEKGAVFLADTGQPRLNRDWL